MAKRKAKRSSGMSSSKMGCPACGGSSCGCKAWGWILLVIGLVYLAVDLNWISMAQWPVHWFTAAFLLMGVKKLWR